MSKSLWPEGKQIYRRKQKENKRREKSKTKHALHTQNECRKKCLLIKQATVDEKSQCFLSSSNAQKPEKKEQWEMKRGRVWEWCKNCNYDMEFALGNLSLLQQEIICFISYTLYAYECLTYFQWVRAGDGRLFSRCTLVSLSVQLQACAMCMQHICTLAFLFGSPIHCSR